MNKKFLVVLIPVFGITMMSAFGQSSSLTASIQRGKTIYEAQCMSCHMTEGEGLESVYPPLAKSDNLKDKNRLAKIVVKGMRGTINVKGVEYSGEMTGFSMNDQEVADVLNFIRNSWGNKNAEIGSAEIQPALKTETKGYQSY